jgi:8-oxo-dGTP pyrophosphatase MutT (NUDIX family)
MTERLKPWGDSRVIAVACCLIFNRSNQLLLLKRHPDDLGGSQWGFPGGRQEISESVEQAVRREVLEETNIKLKQPVMLGRHKLTMPHGVIELVSFRAEIGKNVAIRLDAKEHVAYKWFNLAKLQDVPDLLWGIPTILHDFGLLTQLQYDPTLGDGSSALLIEN